MTNGEKLQETFKVYVGEVGEGMTRFYIAGIMYLTNTEWWNAEYKEPIEQEPRWISVSERLPEKNVEVLATTEWGAVTIAEMYSANDWFIHEGTTNAETDEIAAWMPLPKPYKAETEAEE